MSDQEVLKIAAEYETYRKRAEEVRTTLLSFSKSHLDMAKAAALDALNSGSKDDQTNAKVYQAMSKAYEESAKILCRILSGI